MPDLVSSQGYFFIQSLNNIGSDFFNCMSEKHILLLSLTLEIVLKQFFKMPEAGKFKINLFDIFYCALNSKLSL